MEDADLTMSTSHLLAMSIDFVSAQEVYSSSFAPLASAGLGEHSGRADNYPHSLPASFHLPAQQGEGRPPFRATSSTTGLGPGEFRRRYPASSGITGSEGRGGEGRSGEDALIEAVLDLHDHDTESTSDCFERQGTDQGSLETMALRAKEQLESLTNPVGPGVDGSIRSYDRDHPPIDPYMVHYLRQQRNEACNACCLF